MVHRREAEADADGLKLLRGCLRRHPDRDAQLLEHIGGPGAAGHRAVTMLCHRQPRRRRDDRRRRRDVKRAAAIATGAAGVGHDRMRGVNREHPASQGLSHAGDLVGRLATSGTGSPLLDPRVRSTDSLLNKLEQTLLELAAADVLSDDL